LTELVEVNIKAQVVAVLSISNSGYLIMLLSLLYKSRLFSIILLLLFINNNRILYADEKRDQDDQSINFYEEQRQPLLLESEIERIKQELDREAKDFKQLLTDESIFYVWNEKDIQHISAIPPPWYRNPYYPIEMIAPCVIVYKNMQLFDNSCIKSDLIDDKEIFNRNQKEIFERNQKRQQYDRLKLELEKKEKELKELAKKLKVKLDMSQKLVEMIWGKYDESVSEGKDFGETWTYKDGRWVTFRNGKVDKFQDINQ